MDTVSYNVRTYREALGISQVELGHRLTAVSEKPWHRQSVWAAENGGRAFAIFDMLALMEVLGVSFEDLLREIPAGGSLEQPDRAAQRLEEARANRAVVRN